jgi:hypothetical protein
VFLLKNDHKLKVKGDFLKHLTQDILITRSAQTPTNNKIRQHESENDKVKKKNGKSNTRHQVAFEYGNRRSARGRFGLAAKMAGFPDLLNEDENQSISYSIISCKT